MRKEVTTRVPARKASTAKKTVIVCDFCGADASNRPCCGGSCTCTLCGRDACPKHTKADPTDWQDHPDKYCFVCCELKFSTHAADYAAIEAAHDKAVDALDAKVKKEALERKE